MNPKAKVKVLLVPGEYLSVRDVCPVQLFQFDRHTNL